MNLAKSETIKDGPKRKRVKSEKAQPYSEDTSELTKFHEGQRDDSAFVPPQLDDVTPTTTGKPDDYGADRSSGSASPDIIAHNDATQEESNRRLSLGPTHQQQGLPNEHAVTPTPHYYLLKPGTAGVSRVMIPLDAQTSLTDSLRDQVVQEYSTVYVLMEPPESLPDGFILEEQYLRTAPVNGMGNISEVYADSSTNERLNGGAAVSFDSKVRNGELDPSSILDMLKRDITL